MLLPQPPFDLAVDKTVELYITGALGVIAILGIVYALVHWARTGRPVVFLLFVAGGCMMVFEPLVDTVGACWFADNSYIAFEAYGRPIPVWLCLAYFFYFGIASATAWMAFKKGVTGRQIWLAFGIAMLGDLLFESVLLINHPYAYYGNQPFMLPNGFAAWWMAVNAGIPLVLGAIVYRADDFLRGWRSLYIIPAGLMTSGAVNAIIGWPSWLVINTDLGPVATQLGGLLSFVFAFALIRIVIFFVAADERERRSSFSATLAAA